MSLANMSHRLDLEEMRDEKLTQIQQPVKRHTFPLLYYLCSYHTVLIKQKKLKSRIFHYTISKFIFALPVYRYLLEIKTLACLKVLFNLLCLSLTGNSGIAWLSPWLFLTGYYWVSFHGPSLWRHVVAGAEQWPSTHHWKSKQSIDCDTDQQNLCWKCTGR